MTTKTAELRETTPVWGLSATASPIDPAEVETAQRAVEVMVMWGESVLCVEHVCPPRDVIVEQAGEDETPFEAVVERGGKLFCVLPPDATGWVRIGETTQTFAELAEQDALAPHERQPGSWLYELPEGATARVERAGLQIVVRPTFAARPIAAAATFPWRRHTWFGVSVGVHALVLVMFYLLPPHTSALSLDTISATDRMVEYLEPAPESVPDDPPEREASASQETAGDPGQAHEGDPGQSGRDHAPQTHRRFAIQGDQETPEMARERIEESITDAGAIGALSALMGNWNVPTSPFGAEQAAGFDDFNAIGDLMGDAQGDSFGRFGLGMHGTGRGAGGTGQGTMGVGALGTIGSCRGARCGHGRGSYGRSTGGLRGRQGADVRPISGSARVVGGLSREAIRRVVRRNLRQVRFCYEQGLQSNPSIEGRVIISWQVDPSGVVQGANVASTSLGNAETEQCIANAVRRWTFPQPDGGMPVGVNYPFVLQSNE